MSIRVVLAEDNALLREGMRGLIRGEPDLELVEVCADLDGLLAALDTHHPDVVLTDIRMPPQRRNEDSGPPNTAARTIRAPRCCC